MKINGYDTRQFGEKYNSQDENEYSGHFKETTCSRREIIMTVRMKMRTVASLKTRAVVGEKFNSQVLNVAKSQ